MRALLCRSLDGIGSLEVAEVASPSLGSGQVRIGVRASGVNFPDILMVEGKYQVRPELPFIPGLEVAGVVLECAAGIEHVRPGDRVLAFARRGGGHAEEVVVPGAIVTPIPDAMDFVTAAAFPVAYGTAHFALTHRGHLAAGETLLVLGAAGGVGLAAIEVGKLLGARVLAAASTAEKLANGRYTSAAVVTSFAGVFPMDEPRYVMVMMLDDPKATKETYGFHTAAWNIGPAFGTTVSRIAPMLGVRPDKNREPDMSMVLPFVHEEARH